MCISHQLTGALDAGSRGDTPRGTKSQRPRSVHTTLMTQTQRSVLPLVPLTGSGHLDGTRLCPTCSACPHLCPFPCSQNHTCPSGLRSRTCPALLASPDPLCVPRAARSRLCCRVLVSQNCKEQSLSCFIIPGERSGSEAVMFPTVPYGLFVCSFLCFASKGKTSVHRFEKKKKKLTERLRN